MSLEFLSDEWFAKVKEIRDSAGDVEAPAALADLVINITVKTDDGEKHMAMAGGMIEEGHHDDAPTTLILPADLAKRIFIEGDMSKLMALQSAQPTDEQKQLMKQIQDITA